MPNAENQLKKYLLEQWLKEGLTQVFVNSQDPQVIVPDHLRGDPGLILNLSWRFGTPMELTDEGVLAELSFSGQSTRVYLPWESIWALRAKEGKTLVFEVAVKEAMPGVEPIDTGKIVKEINDKLEVVNGENESTPPRKGHLKLVH